MNFLNKYKIIILLVLLVLILGGGSYYILIGSKSSSTNQTTQAIPTSEVIPTLNPEDLGLKLTARSDGKAVKFEITNIKDIESVEYELTYLAKGNIPRGTIGTVEIKPTDTKIETKYLDLGSCSSGKCKYDEGVTSVKLVLKITKKDGNVYSAEKSLDL